MRAVQESSAAEWSRKESAAERCRRWTVVATVLPKTSA